MKNQRIWAVIGLILIVASILSMTLGMFIPAAKALLMQIALVGFVGAAGILLALSVIRKKAAEDEGSTKEE